MAAANNRNPPAAPGPVNVDVLLSELLDLRIEDLGLNLNELIYQGFHPREFLMSIFTKARQSQVHIDQHKKNMVFLGLVCAMRGSKINKIATSSGTSPALINRLTNLITIYDIKEGRPEGPITATLPRFLAVTAIPVSKIINSDAGQIIRLPIRPDEIAQGYPLVFCMSHSGGLLPSGLDVPLYWYKAVAYGQYIMSLKFNAQPRKAQVLQFVQIAARSNLWTNEQKAAHLISLGLMNNRGFIDEVDAAMREAAAKFDSLPY